MNILALDCSTSVLGIGVCRSDGKASGADTRTKNPKHPYATSEGHSPIPGFVQLHIDAGYRHAERIIRGIEFCCEEAGLKPEELDLLACTGGPGSFTGLRIAASTIKGLALSLQKPHIFVPTLDAFAYGKENIAPLVVPLIDAKRGHFYYALYQQGKRVSGPFDAPLSSVLESVREADFALFTGPDADLLEETAREHEGWSCIPEKHESAVYQTLLLAEPLYKAKGPAAPDEGPEYLRLSDAEEALQKA